MPKAVAPATADSRIIVWLLRDINPVFVKLSEYLLYQTGGGDASARFLLSIDVDFPVL
jgi:hypothetical protein